MATSKDIDFTEAPEPTWSAKAIKEYTGGSVIFFRIFRFFSSVQLAFFIILGLMAVFAAGTIVESFHGTETAALVVYQSAWFPFILFLLGVNVTASAVDRLPWKKKHIGFVMTHAGIIIILIGSFITKVWMVDAQMAIEEGETEHRITLPDTILYVLSPEENREWRIPLQKKAFAWEGEEKIKTDGTLPFEIKKIGDYPKGILREEIVPSENGMPALKVTLRNSFLEQKMELIKNHAEKGQMNLGPATVKFTDSLLKESEAEIPQNGYLEFQFPETSVRIAIDYDWVLPVTRPIEGTPYQITIQELYRQAAIVEGKLVDQYVSATAPSENETGKNPAAVLRLEGEGLSEKHTVFALFPEFPTMHGMVPSKAGVRIYYRLPASPAGGPGGGSRGESHELRFVQNESELLYQIQDGFKVTTGTVEQGKEVSLGWMDLSFTVDEIYENAELRKTFTATANHSERTDAFPAMEFRIGSGAESRSLWLAKGFPEKVNIGGKTFHLLYGERKIPAGFKLTLVDFRVTNYPGTNRAASFESDVVLRDDFEGIEKKVTISMNEPLDHKGYRIFQASYVQPEQGPEISVFSVVTDPGIPVKYSGVVIMISGILLMFATGRFKFLKRAK